MNTYFYLIAAFLDYYKITTRYVKKMRKYAKVYVRKMRNGERKCLSEK